MKNYFRRFHIGVLALLAVVVTSCSMNRDGLSKKEKRLQLQQRLDSINGILEKRENSCIYGPPEVMQLYREETNRLKHEADSLTSEMEKLK
jgi:hypothetical protein